MVLEIRRPLEPVVREHHRNLVFVQQRTHLLARPDVVLAFLVLRIGVERRIVAALRRLHLAHHPGCGLLAHAREQRIAGNQPGVRVQLQQRSVVVKHLLEVRDQPVLIHAVAAETAAELVVDSALRHFLEREQHQFAQPRVAVRAGRPQAESEFVGMREFRRAAQTPMHFVETGAQIRSRSGYRRSVERDFAVRRRQRAAHELEQGFVLLIDLRTLAAIDLRDLLEQRPESRQAVTRGFRKVGAAEERLLPRGEKHRQRPAAGALRQHVMRGLVDLVEVGPLFAIDLDVDEQRGSSWPRSAGPRRTRAP